MTIASLRIRGKTDELKRIGILSIFPNILVIYFVLFTEQDLFLPGKISSRLPAGNSLSFEIRHFVYRKLARSFYLLFKDPSIPEEVSDYTAVSDHLDIRFLELIVYHDRFGDRNAFPSLSFCVLKYSRVSSPLKLHFCWDDSANRIPFNVCSGNKWRRMKTMVKNKCNN